MEVLRELLAVYLACMTLGLVFLLLQLPISYLFGLTPTAVHLGLGPTPFRYERGEVKMAVAPLSIGAFVRYPGEDDERGRRGLHDLRPLPALLVNLGPWLLLAALALVLLGPERTIREFVAAPRQLMTGAWAPLTRGNALVAAWMELRLEHGFLAGTAVLATKQITLNVLPLSGKALEAVLGRLGRRAWSTGPVALLIVSMLVLIALWCVGVVSAASSLVD